MTAGDWIRFGAAYIAGAAGIGAVALAFDALRGRPYDGVPLIALGLGPLFCVTLEFARRFPRGATPPSSAFVMKVMGALVVLGVVLVATVATVAHWERGWPEAVVFVLIGAIILPLASVLGRRSVQRAGESIPAREPPSMK